MGFVENFIRFAAVQQLWKSIKIWQRYRQSKGGNFFETRCTCNLFVANVVCASLRYDSDDKIILNLRYLNI